MVTSRLTGGDLQWRHFHFSITESEQDQAVDDNSPPDGVSCYDQIHFKIHTFLWKWTFPATILICEAPDFHYISRMLKYPPSFNGYSWLYKLQESSMNLTRDLALLFLETLGISGIERNRPLKWSEGASWYFPIEILEKRFCDLSRSWTSWLLWYFQSILASWILIPIGW